MAHKFRAPTFAREVRIQMKVVVQKLGLQILLIPALVNSLSLRWAPWGGKGQFQSIVLHEGKWGRTWGRGHGGTVPTDLLPMAYSVYHLPKRDSASSEWGSPASIINQGNAPQACLWATFSHLGFPLPRWQKSNHHTHCGALVNS